MADITNYLTRAQAAEKFGITVTTLKKYEIRATEEGYGLPEPVKFGNTSVWHESDWNHIQAMRLEPYIDEAVSLKMAVRYEDHESVVKKSYEDGYEDGKAEMKVEAFSEDAEKLSFVEGAGLTSGGFMPLGTLGL